MSFRFLDGSQVNGVPVDKAVDLIEKWISDRINTAPDSESFAL